MAIDILKYIPVPAFLVNENTLAIVDVNHQAEILMGMSKVGILNLTLKDLIPNSILKERGEIDSIPFCIKDGKKISGNLNVVQSPDNSELLVYTFVKDDIENEKTMFYDLMEGTSQGIIILNRKAVLVDVNSAFCDIMKVKREKLIGKSGLFIAQKSLSFETVKRKIVPAIKNIVLGNTIPEFDIDYDGRIYAVSSNVKSGAKYYVILVRDMTEIHQQQERIKESEELYRTLFHSSKDAIFTMNAPDWTFQTFNESFLKLFGFTDLSQLIGVSPWELSPHEQPDGTISENASILYLEEAQKRGYSFFDWQHRKIDGTIFWAKVLLTFVERGKDSFIQATIRDITEQRELEHELIAAKNKAEESDRLKTAFLANISHEVRTPMNGILGFTELLQSDNLSQDQINSSIDLIRTSGKRMLETVNAIIEISQIETGEVNITYEFLGIDDQLRRLYQQFKSEANLKNIELVYVCACDKCVFLKTDISKFNAIFTNLIKNAIKFTNEGKVEFGCRQVEKKGSDMFEFFVHDTGIGIPKIKLDNIFRRFEQIDSNYNRNYEGFGLGLSICKAYADMLGTDIIVDTKVGVGSRFSFTLPFDPIKF